MQAGVLNVPASAPVPARLSLVTRPGLGSFLAARVPPLTNSPGITSLDGVAVGGPAFNENLPLRDGVPLAVTLSDGTSPVIRSPVINTVPGAMAIQEVLERQEWAARAGSPVAYAPHLRKDPLPGVPAKSVIVQFAKGDLAVPNPTTTALLRAGDLADRATYYRHDLAFAEAVLAAASVPGSPPLLEEHPKARLLEMVVAGQGVSDPVFGHDDERDSIG